MFDNLTEHVTGLINQNANAYREGVGDMPQQIFLPLRRQRNETPDAAAPSLSE